LIFENTIKVEDVIIQKFFTKSDKQIKIKFLM